jgi:tight adherence protein C
MNENMMITILIFCMLLLLFLAIFLFYRQKQDKGRLIDKINQYATQRLPKMQAADENKGGFLGDLRQFFMGLTTKLAPYSQPKDETKASHRRQKMIMAGYDKPRASVIFYGLKIILAVLLPILVYVGVILSKTMMGYSLLATLLVAAALLGFYTPELWVDMAISRRQQKIQDGFPDALDLMVVCVEAGMGLDQAIKRISDEMQTTHKTISQEFAKMNMEMRAGRSRRDAMRNLADRTGVADVNTLVTLLIQTDKFGTSIAQALRTLSTSMRIKRRQRAEELAMKLPVKLLFPLILFIFPSLFVIIIGPGAIRVFRVLIKTGFGAG